MQFSALLSLTCAALATARSISIGRRQDFLKQNGEDAIALNQKFATLTADSPCNDGDNACVQNSFAKCDHGKFALSPCGTDEVCAALPLVLSPGTSVTCTTADQRDARIAATGATPPSNSTASASQSASLSASITASITSSVIPLPSASASANSTGGATGNSTVPTGSGNSTSPDSGDPQTSFTLSPQVIAHNFTQDGQSQTEPGQTPSLTSPNNFINFCLTVPDLPITNGQQITSGSCNPAPMGIIAATTNMPSTKFAFPTNGAVLPANTTFTVRLAVQHLATGFFANADTNFLAAPQTVDAASGDIRGHSHVVVERLDGGLAQTTPTDPSRFAFFKGLNAPAQAGVLTTDVPNGLPAGAYRIASITTAANHQPVLVAIAQHGAMDDMVYFTVQDDGADNTTASAPASIPGSATLPAASSTVISSASLGISTSSAILGVSASASSTASVI